MLLTHAIPDPLDRERNRIHARALATVSRCMGTQPWDQVAFLYGRLVCGRTVPF